ncbi:MAG: aldolase/citrate lyase family protein [Pigmentiphaga sp.]|uniref:HpcH/HpaI aldolase family protein n=1 Tax=Pigmentiphaga sp. TaxID=1977564 RepID=UPI0029AA2016|nr:aldolase/citrate lyase family protein [Pigmentiphaga sp.]MDX3906366.1 aldolase/citrate lyase family protein [Pigmentiphaga sp.]
MTTQRLNGLIRKLESGGIATMSFCPPTIESAIAFSTTKYDGVLIECEHQPWNPLSLRDTFQYLLNRRLIAASGSIAPSVTPIVRIPANGAEHSQWLAKQALDLGAYGIVWPHISTVEQAYAAIAACRYPTLESHPLHQPFGQRGDGPTSAVRYWGLTQQEYYAKADVWPLNPNGEIFAMLMIEDLEGIGNLRDILKQVPGIGAVMIGEGDLSQELGIPRQYEHPELLSAMAEIRAACKEFNVPVAHPHVTTENAEHVFNEGYRILVCGPSRTYPALDKVRQLAGG